MQTTETMNATTDPAIPNPSTWGERRSAWDMPVSPPDHALRIKPSSVGSMIAVEIDVPGKAGVSGWCFLSPEAARQAARRLQHLADEVTLAGEDSLSVVRQVLAGVNDARGTNHTIESVAASLGIDLEGVTRAEAWQMTRYVGELLAS